MRRSSTTRSPPATVLRRLQGEKLLKNSAENSNPNHQDDPDGVDAEPGGVHVHGEGQDGADHKQEQTKANPHLVAPRQFADAVRVAIGSLLRR
jgi:hypothetical protein